MKIAFTSDTCSRLHIIIKSHDLRASDNRRAMGEILSTTRGISFLPFFASCELLVFGPFFGLLL